MTKKRLIILILILSFILLPTTFAQTEKVYHLKLLAVQDIPGQTYTGSDADVYLELKEGSGRVFLETTPLTKLDTQISTRFAKEIACAHFKLKCNNYDFIYTIKSKSNIVGGPSAGAAIAAITTIGILDLKHDERVTITGTINSGGTIGPVGGIKEKLEAASKAGLQKVMIASGSAVQKINETENASLNLLHYGPQNLSLEVQEVLNLDEVIYELTGINLNHKDTNITENPRYTEIMKNLQELLCQRTEKIEQEIKEQSIKVNENVSQSINEKKASALNASIKNDLYASASYCFGANIQLRTYYYKEKKPSPNQIKTLLTELKVKTAALTQQVQEEKITTIADLQTVMIVQERLNDVEQQIEQSNKSSPEALFGLLAYAEERYHSATSWMQFFSMDGRKFVFDTQRIENSCQQKLAESDERYQYVNLFIGPYPLQGINEKISNGKKAAENGDFPLCLITASQAKAEANAILSSLGIDDKGVQELINAKQKAVERLIADNSKEDVFPILGYSYYRYAQSLREQDQYTALVYLEYALEMSDLNMYFPEEATYLEKVQQKLMLEREWLLIVEGFLAGIIVTLTFSHWKRKKTKTRPTQKP